MENGSGKSYPVEYYGPGAGLTGSAKKDCRPIRLFIIDDHIPYRSELCRSLKELPDIQICGEAGSVQGAQPAIVQANPDVLLIEVELDGVDGVQATQLLLKQNPRNRIILMSLHNDEDRVLEGLRAGALAHISKFSQPEEFAQAIRTVHHGEAWIDKQTTARVLRELRRSYGTP